MIHIVLSLFTLSHVDTMVKNKKMNNWCINISIWQCTLYGKYGASCKRSSKYDPLRNSIKQIEHWSVEFEVVSTSNIGDQSTFCQTIITLMIFISLIFFYHVCSNHTEQHIHLQHSTSLRILSVTVFLAQSLMSQGTLSYTLLDTYQKKSYKKRVLRSVKSMIVCSL